MLSTTDKIEAAIKTVLNKKNSVFTYLHSSFDTPT